MSAVLASEAVGLIWALGSLCMRSRITVLEMFKVTHASVSSVASTYLFTC